MTDSRWKSGTISRKSSSRLPERSGDWTDRPVTLPPGRRRLTTNPLPTGSDAVAKTIGTVAFEPQKADGSFDAGIHFKFDIKANKVG
jgi:hypothetical protein